MQENNQEHLLINENEKPELSKVSSDQQKSNPSRMNLQNKEMKVFLFEFLGMSLFSYGIIASKGNDALLALFFLAAVCFAAPFSGAHINPAVTVAMLLCRKINFGLAMIYWMAQLSGAFVGAFICYLVLGEVTSPSIKDIEIHWIISDVCGELLATFIFITFILIQAHPDTTFTPDAQPLTTYCLIALSLYISRGYTTHSGGCLNPGMAISLTAFESYHTNDDIDRMANLWIWVMGPLGGSLLASIFYEVIFKKLHNR